MTLGIGLRKGLSWVRFLVSEVPLSFVTLLNLPNTSGCTAPQMTLKTCVLPHLYRGTSLIRNTPPVGPYSSPMRRDLW